jgi:hypothetical protein
MIETGFSSGSRRNGTLWVDIGRAALLFPIIIRVGCSSYNNCFLLFQLGIIIGLLLIAMLFSIFCIIIF